MVKILTAYLMADFLAGVFHWFEDRILTDDAKIPWWLESIRADNGDHHAKPGAIVRFTKWQNIKTSAFVAWPLCLLSVSFGFYWIAYVFFFGSFANLIHRWSHAPMSQKPLWVQVLQSTGLFITNQQHHLHHYHGTKLIKKEHTTGNYCVMTTWLNPILDGIGFWLVLNRICGA